MTEGPWWIDLGAVAATVTAMGIIWKMLLWPGMKTTWRAIIAAPQLAAGVGRLVEILETDILHRVETLELDLTKQSDCLVKLLKEVREINSKVEKVSKDV